MSRRVLQGLLANQNQFKPFILKVKTDNAGTSASNQFTIPTYVGEVYNYTVKYDGQTLTNQTGDVTLTFPSGAGEYDVSISGTFSGIYFNDGGDKLKLIDVKQWGSVVFQSLSVSFWGCSNCVFSATDIITDGGITSLQNTWLNCSSMVTSPKVNHFTGVNNIINTWTGCSSLINQPDVSNLNGFVQLANAFLNCVSLANILPNQYDNVTQFNYGNMYQNTNLTQQSIDNVLVSIDASGASNGTFVQSGGSAPSATGKAAIDNLRAKGWSITVTGGY